MAGYYSSLSTIEIIIMTIALQSTHLLGIPIIRLCFSKKVTHFEGCLFIMNFFASFMFHFCEIYTTEMFLSQLQWQRLDNICTITSFQIIILHLCGAIYGEDLKLKFIALFSTLIIQEKDPWNFTYTIIPLVSFCFIGVGIALYYKDKRVIIYQKNQMLKAVALLTCGSFFFVKGLQEEQDYLRLNHAAWHIFGTAFAYYCLKMVSVKPGYEKLDVLDKQIHL